MSRTIQLVMCPGSKDMASGRVFYSSPSHNAQSYENTEMLQYYLNGMQYVLGDLACDDSPIQP